LTDNPEYQTLEKYCREHDEKEITKEQLFIGVDTNSANPKPNNYQPVIGIVVGVGAVILTGIIIFLLSRKRKGKINKL